MDVYKISNQNKLEVVNNTSFETEKEIQNLIENNLEILFNLTFVKTEVVCEQFRFDTLCWDDENKSFIIIEYKFLCLLYDKFYHKFFYHIQPLV